MTKTEEYVSPLFKEHDSPPGIDTKPQCISFSCKAWERGASELGPTEVMAATVSQIKSFVPETVKERHTCPRQLQGFNLHRFFTCQNRLTELRKLLNLILA